MAQDRKAGFSLPVEEAGTNLSSNVHLMDLINARQLSRRQVLKGGLSVSALALFGSLGLAGCSDDDNDESVTLGFTAVPKSLADTVSVPTGYTVNALYRLGDPIAAGVAAFANDGTDSGFNQRAGDHHDGMHYFGLSAGGTADANSSVRGLLAINHENITAAYLHANGPSAAPRPETEARKEIECHGISIVEIAKSGGSFAYVQDSAFNRRITPFTEFDLSGPVKGSDHVKTRFSPDGSKTRGTINNCANGYTPWGTYLSCEENWAGYFKRAADDDSKRAAAAVTLLKRVGIAQGSSGNNAWATVTPADPADTSYSRWDASVLGASAAEDFRNEPNTFGYVIEVDPYTASSKPKKRTALGRFAHEGCWAAPAESGKPLVFYMGDDSRGDYIYKFVTTANWDPADANGGLAAGDKYLDAGTLYVAKFKADGSGEWLALQQGSNGLTADNAVYPFSTQADVIIATRLAADVAGATKMDRPEWATVNPANGEVYVTLTNNSNRGINPAQPLDAANPRNYDSGTDSGNTDLDGNANGHIIRWKEDGSQSATSFKWDVYLFAARAAADPVNVNLSALTDDNDLSSPDGLWFSPVSGLLWIQTDDGAYTGTTNCMMLAAVPGQQGDGAAKDVVSGAVTTTTYVGKAPGTNLRRFLVGPKECEITGITETPDGKTLFVNIQHPGEDGDPADITSHFPDGGNSRPRSATVVITKNDGGQIGL